MTHQTPIHLSVPWDAYGKTWLPRFADTQVKQGVSALWFVIGKRGDLSLIKDLVSGLREKAVLSFETPVKKPRRGTEAPVPRSVPLLDPQLVRDALKTVAGNGSIAVSAKNWPTLADLIGQGPDSRGLPAPPDVTIDVGEYEGPGYVRHRAEREGGRGLQAAGLEVSGSDISKLLDELSKAKEALEAKGVKKVFFRLFHPDPVLHFNLNRLLRRRLDAPIVITLHETDEDLPFSAAGIAAGLSAGLSAGIAAGALLSEGIGDALLVYPVYPRAPSNRAELSEFEARAGSALERAKRILGMLRRFPKGYELISCPTCGRCQVDVEGMAREVDARMRELEAELRREGKELAGIGGITVAVMGCNVNGPGEARAADIGIAGGKNGRGTIFIKGVPAKTLPEVELVEALLNGARALIAERSASRDEPSVT